ncbi:hypothetical protein MMC29_000169 [Sticta canariensis]|nr:hypothetical protein [Sticta canariensis]
MEAKFNAANHPEVNAYFMKYIGQKNLSSSMLRNRLLQEEISTLDETMATNIKGLESTLVMDGWSNKKRKHLAAAVLLVEGKPYSTIVHDNSSVKKNRDLAYNQLLDEITLVIERYNDMLETIDPRDNNHIEAKTIFDVIRDANFWEDIKLLACLLEPFAITALILQANSTRLDHVILCLDKLYTQFEAWLGNSPSDHERQSIIAVFKSLEKRWAEADQDLFIAAIILNVFVGRDRLCFSSDITAWKNQGLFKTIQRVYYRLFQKVPPPTILDEWTNYKCSSHEFSDGSLLIQEHHALAKSKKESPNPLRV